MVFQSPGTTVDDTISIKISKLQISGSSRRCAGIRGDRSLVGMILDILFIFKEAKRSQSPHFSDFTSFVPVTQVTIRVIKLRNESTAVCNIEIYTYIQRLACYSEPILVTDSQLPTTRLQVSRIGIGDTCTQNTR